MLSINIVNACLDDTNCDHDDIRYRDCGKCGYQVNNCDCYVFLDYQWRGVWSDCFSEGECEKGKEEIQNCGTNSAGTQTRTCGDDCEWPPDWSTCEYDCTPGSSSGIPRSDYGDTSCCSDSVLGTDDKCYKNANGDIDKNVCTKNADSSSTGFVWRTDALGHEASASSNYCCGDDVVNDVVNDEGYISPNGEFK